MDDERKGEERWLEATCSARLGLHSIGCQFTGTYGAQGGRHFSEEGHPSEGKDNPSARVSIFLGMYESSLAVRPGGSALFLKPVAEKRRKC